MNKIKHTIKSISNKIKICYHILTTDDYIFISPEKASVSINTKDVEIEDESDMILHTVKTITLYFYSLLTHLYKNDEAAMFIAATRILYYCYDEGSISDVFKREYFKVCRILLGKANKNELEKFKEANPKTYTEVMEYILMGVTPDGDGK